MMDRRKFMGGVATSLAASRVLAYTNAGYTTLALFDARYGAATAFADNARRSGCEILDTQQDIVRHWYSGLHARCSERGIKLIGLTTYSDLDVLQECVRPLGLRVRDEQDLQWGSASLVLWSVT
jgi:hypothetical protein